MAVRMDFNNTRRLTMRERGERENSDGEKHAETKIGSSDGDSSGGRRFSVVAGIDASRVGICPASVSAASRRCRTNVQARRRLLGRHPGLAVPSFL